MQYSFCRLEKISNSEKVRWKFDLHKIWWSTFSWSCKLFLFKPYYQPNMRYLVVQWLSEWRNTGYLQQLPNHFILYRLHSLWYEWSKSRVWMSSMFPKEESQRNLCALIFHHSAASSLLYMYKHSLGHCAPSPLQENIGQKFLSILWPSFLFIWRAWMIHRLTSPIITSNHGYRGILFMLILILTWQMSLTMTGP